MGYYTQHELRVLSGNTGLIETLREENENAAYALGRNGSTGEACKWYASEQDLKSFSKQYPNEVFELIGEGEESGDLWKRYFKNGKVQYCKAKITYDEYSESLLK